MALPLPILERLSFLLTIVGGSGISNKCRSSSLRILKKIHRIKVKKLQEKCLFDEKYTYIFRLIDKFEQDAGRLIVLVVVLCTQLLYFFMIAFIRSFSKELYASSRTILRKNINMNSFFFQFVAKLQSFVYCISKFSFGANCCGNGIPRLFPSDESRSNLVAIFLIF